ncbi:MAG TPA: hypothetical protein VGM63_19725, partial [Mucilaginibacter sp.]
MTLAISGKQLHMVVTNSTAAGDAQQVVNYGGIGLKNVQRRLDLIYPGQYQLDIQNTPESFSIKLDLQLSEFTISPTTQLMA